ncbi:hypothetical protein GP2_035_00050 [Gordonia paraffinivorans NBRC 108238]|uniref:DUF2238 domain-containing protein n=1 Tax=Gordonia paraffinivorans NBRC 108238 TaxID=1223543 RepID=A0ABQ0IRG9_9ACTN|nr:hypothetical protein GP2_035_00050 [Gordonia paraffinivorans NBRC 108238]
MGGALAGSVPGLSDRAGSPRAAIRHTERGTPLTRTLISAAFFLPLLAWWPMVLWLFTFDANSDASFAEYHAEYVANGPTKSLVAIWVLTAAMPVYMVLVLAFWSRSIARAAFAVPMGAVGALGFWGGQIPVLVRSGEYEILDFCSDHMPAFVVLLIVAWSIARRRQFWWILAVPVIGLLAVNSYEGWAVSPVDTIVEGVGQGLGVPASPVLDPFSPRFRSPLGDIVDIIAGVLTLWLVDAVLRVMARQGRDEAGEPARQA